MDRRTFVNALGAMLVIQASVANAQRAAAPRVIGVFSAEPFPPADLWVHLYSKLRELGWIEGTNLIFERRSANNQLDQLPNLATELVRLNVDIILALGTQAPLAAKKATSTIPIIIFNAANPIELGLVTSLARPGGNITGIGRFSSHDIAGKRLQLLKETLPGLSRVTLILNPNFATNVMALQDSEAAAPTLGLELRSVEVRRVEDFDSAFETALHQRPDALITAENVVTMQARARIITFAAANHLPALYPFKEFAEAGGLMSYGPDLNELIDLVAKYIDRILKGARPGDLPIEQATKFQLVINLKTAKALGLTIPQTLLARADEVIQ